MGLYLCMTVLLPYHEFLSGSHWLYMFGHAGWLHYLLNGMAWAFLWKVITPARRMDVRCRNIIFYSFRQSCDRMECHYLLLYGLVPVLHGWGKA